MSNLYNRVFTGFYEHRKTRQLRRILGNDAFWIPPRLWAFAAEHEPSGTFDGYTAEEVAEAISYEGDAPSMLQALVKVGFMDEDPLRIHNWESYNRFHKTFSERAKKAAEARWKGNGIPPPTPPTQTETRTGTLSKHASSMHADSPPRLSASELIAAEHSLKRLESDLQQLEGRISCDAMGTRIYESGQQEQRAELCKKVKAVKAKLDAVTT